MSDEQKTAFEAHQDDESPTRDLDQIALYNRLRDYFDMDMQHSAEWRAEAKENFGFVAGDQWSRLDKSYLEEQGRPVITFNRTLSIIKSVAGIEINNRHETVYIPRGVTPGEVRANEILTAASQWMSDNCDAEDEQSAAFQDSLVTGMGWTEAVIDYDEDPDGRYVETRVDPLEMYWDRSARSKNLQDARRVFRVRKMSLAEARDLFPGVPDYELDAPWAIGAETERVPKPVEERRKKIGHGDAPDNKTDVHIVQAQWWDRVPYWRVVDPMSGEILSLSEEEYDAMCAQYEEQGLDKPESVQLFKKVYRQAFLGGSILGSVRPGPCPDRFSFNCITGEIDRNRGVWFGLVTLMKDPQMWANKWLSQTLHILNTTAKGGIIAESDAFKDQRAAQETYAKPDAITWAAKGAIAGGKIMQKPGVGIPNTYVNLLEFAISSIRDVTGINLELLGLRDANQPGILEAQRKQAAMTILGTLYDSLRRFRKNVGRVRLHYIQEYLADGRMIRIAGRDGMELVPLMKDQTLGDYEIIVEDAPSSPNQKEAVWGTIQQMLPMIKDLLTPESAVEILEYSPLPEKLVSMFRQMLNEPPSPEQMQLRQAEITKALADLRSTDAKTAKDAATAGKVRADTDKTIAEAEAVRAKAILDLAQAGAVATKAQMDTAMQNVMSPQPWTIQPMMEDLVDPGPFGGPQLPQVPSLPTQPKPQDFSEADVMQLIQSRMSREQG